jgi:tetracenomycin A2 monooxygenase-dioxygenase
MEIYRSLGIEDEIRAQRAREAGVNLLVRGKNLTDPDMKKGEVAWPDASDISPTAHATCEQDRLEPILRSHAERHGAEILFNTELVEFEQDHAGVYALIRNINTQEECRVEASYLIAVDGVNGTIREMLGIRRHGPGALQHWVNVIFDTNLQSVLNDLHFTGSMLTDINGSLVSREGSDHWSMSVQYFPERGQHPENFTEDYCRELIRKGAGRSDFNAEIVDVRSWVAAAYVAEKFKEGRVFLVGDAAHVMPPTGGFGGNTGIHDAHNLAWKLEAVMNGTAGPQLLETYDCERMPVAEHTMEQALARLQAWFKDPAKKLPPPVEIVLDYNVVFGYKYHQGAIIPVEGDGADQAFEDPHAPSGRLGTRAAHISVEFRGERRSTIDLFAGKWVLVVGPGGSKWLEGAVASKKAEELELQCYMFGPGGELKDIENRHGSAYGLDSDRAMLIRPDGFIAWRSRGLIESPETVLQKVFRLLTFEKSS